MMLDRFKVPAKDQVLVSETDLRRTVTQIFEKLGVSAEDAADAADALTMTDLRGVETHGVSNMLRAYVRDYRAGKLDPRPGWRIVRESPGTAVIDAERRLGIIVGPKAMRLAVDKARAVGVGVVTVYNSGHFGAIGHFAMQAAQQDMIGVCFTGASVSVVPTFAAKPMIGTNPIAIAAPARREAPLLFDAATSAIAGNKIRLAIRLGSPLLPGWVSDKEGNPITEEKPVFDRDEYYQLPLGGTREQGSRSWPRCSPPCSRARCPRCSRRAAAARITSPRTTSPPSRTSSTSRTPWTACSRRCARRRRRPARSACSIPACRSSKRRSSGGPRVFRCTRKCCSGSASARVSWASHPCLRWADPFRVVLA